MKSTLHSSQRLLETFHLFFYSLLDPVVVNYIMKFLLNGFKLSMGNVDIFCTGSVGVLPPMTSPRAGCLGLDENWHAAATEHILKLVHKHHQVR